MFYIHDLGAPESWEVADLDERMSRLMLSSSSSKKDSSSSSFLDASIPASAFASAPALSSSLVLVGSGMISEDSINQMDQFLREALQNPRELPRSRVFPLESYKGKWSYFVPLTTMKVRDGSMTQLNLDMKRCVSFKSRVPKMEILLSLTWR